MVATATATTARRCFLAEPRSEEVAGKESPRRHRGQEHLESLGPPHGRPRSCFPTRPHSTSPCRKSTTDTITMLLSRGKVPPTANATPSAGCRIGRMRREVPTKTWRSAMSTVRELKLRAQRQKNASCLPPFRPSIRCGPEASSRSPDDDRAGHTHAARRGSLREIPDISLTLDPLKAKESGISVLGDAMQDVPAAKRWERESAMTRRRSRFSSIDRTPAKSDSLLAFPGRSVADFKTRKDGLVHLRVIVDSSSVEVFADDGKLVLTETVYPAAGADKVSLFAAEARPAHSLSAVRHLGSTARVISTGRGPTRRLGCRRFARPGPIGPAPRPLAQGCQTTSSGAAHLRRPSCRA